MTIKELAKGCHVMASEWFKRFNNLFHNDYDNTVKMIQNEYRITKKRARENLKLNTHRCSFVIIQENNPYKDVKRLIRIKKKFNKMFTDAQITDIHLTDWGVDYLDIEKCAVVKI